MLTPYKGGQSKPEQKVLKILSYPWTKSPLKGHLFGDGMHQTCYLKVEEVQRQELQAELRRQREAKIAAESDSDTDSESSSGRSRSRSLR